MFLLEFSYFYIDVQTCNMVSHWDTLDIFANQAANQWVLGIGVQVQIERKCLNACLSSFVLYIDVKN